MTFNFSRHLVKIFVFIEVGILFTLLLFGYFLTFLLALLIVKVPICEALLELESWQSLRRLNQSDFGAKTFQCCCYNGLILDNI